MRTFLLTILILVTFTICETFILCFAQTNEGSCSIEGKVTDQTGAVIPGAEVSIRSQATIFEIKTFSNVDGFYRINNLRPGKYEVSAIAIGFEKKSTEIT